MDVWRTSSTIQLTRKEGIKGREPITGAQVGKINLFDNTAFVAVNKRVANDAVEQLSKGKMKGRNFKVRMVR